MPEATAAGVKIVGPEDAKEGFLGSIGVRFMIDGSEADERFSLVEHPMSARALAAPLHLHTREDEYSFVLEGRMGALLGDGVVEAGPGDLVFKPRNQWHTFWNAGDEPCRILEIISPAGAAGPLRRSQWTTMAGVGLTPTPAMVGCAYTPWYSSWRRHHSYGFVCGYPPGESSHSSWRPSGVRSRKVQTLPRASTPRAVVKYVRKTLSPSRRKTLRPKFSPSW